MDFMRREHHTHNFYVLKMIQTMFLEILSTTDKSCDKQLSNFQDLRYIFSDKGGQHILQSLLGLRI